MNNQEWIESKKLLSEKIKDLFNLSYDFDNDAMVFPDGRTISKTDFDRSPSTFFHKLHDYEMIRLQNLVLEHSKYRPYDALEYLGKARFS